MTPGNEELVRVVVSLAVTLPAVATVIVMDERRLTGRELERAWPPQSRDCAIFTLVNLGVPQLCVLIHFLKTRQSARGFVIGMAWVVAIGLSDVCARFVAVSTIHWLGL
jgi:hypothetical protein